jgi:hypothetical protein
LVPDNTKLTREVLEEAVLASQRTLSHHPVSQKIPFCCFNGGSDVWVDVGDKSLGVAVLQRCFNNLNSQIEIWGGNTLHIGDQFMSLGGNDFKAVCSWWCFVIIVEESLYDSVGCESGGDGGVVGGVVGVSGGKAGGGVRCGCGALNWEVALRLGCLCIARYTQTNSMAHSVFDTDTAGPTSQS